jgi:hypothetical protein
MLLDSFEELIIYVYSNFVKFIRHLKFKNFHRVEIFCNC